MKKDIYVVIGISALVLAGFMGALFIYNRSHEPKETATGIAGEDYQNRVDLNLLLGEGSPSIGPTMSKVQIVEFLDPECESCRAMHPYLKSILKSYEGKVRYTLRYMPLHPNSVYAASLLEASRNQYKFWEALDLIFEKQPEWANHHAPRPELLIEFLRTLKLNITKLKTEAQKLEIKARIDRDKQDGMQIGVRSTPTFFVNGRILQELGERPLRDMIDEELGAK